MSYLLEYLLDKLMKIVGKYYELSHCCVECAIKFDIYIYRVFGSNVECYALDNVLKTSDDRHTQIHARTQLPHLSLQ